VAEAEQARPGSGMTTRDLPGGMREVRINHRAMEAEQ
jgi:hypothetical protein